MHNYTHHAHRTRQVKIIFSFMGIMMVRSAASAVSAVRAVSMYVEYGKYSEHGILWYHCCCHFLQVLDTSYDAKLPSAYTDWLGRPPFSWVRLDWTSLILPSGCVPLLSSSASSFRIWLVIKGALPMLVIVASVLLTAAIKCARLGFTKKNFYLGLLKGTPIALIISFCYVPSVSMSIFQSWLWCRLVSLESYAQRRLVRS